ncbi:glycine cleavage system aminomethyltransferase GcvT [Alkalilimnicola ehrlichii]|uniref:glycine cleavage system aminomethyltransferase GcvT n=1 Tax=Alkalilimnicola ehrlichii TaxID=351052 RepID=UPI003BA3B739
MQRTPLYRRHQEAGARLVEFAGWQMPLDYGSALAEHRAVREDCGLFDVSHMAITDLEGQGARDALRLILAADVARLDEAAPGKALYGCLLNEAGGIIDDLIVFRRGAERYRIVSNAATRGSVQRWLERLTAAFGLQPEARTDLAMIALQGPAAPSLIEQLPEAAAAVGLGAFEALDGERIFVSRTGYTGEDGFELILPGPRASQTWDHLVAAGARPCGLAARDSLRLEAGLNLNGQDMTPETTPLECGLGWTVHWTPEDRDFIGRHPLEAQRREGAPWCRQGLVLRERGVPRHGHAVLDAADRVIGEVTSGGWSPVLQRGIALARVPNGTGEPLRVRVRDRALSAEPVRPPFVRNGKPRVDVPD